MDIEIRHMAFDKGFDTNTTDTGGYIPRIGDKIDLGFVPLPIVSDVIFANKRGVHYVLILVN